MYVQIVAVNCLSVVAVHYQKPCPSSSASAASAFSARSNRSALLHGWCVACCAVIADACCVSGTEYGSRFHSASARSRSSFQGYSSPTQHTAAEGRVFSSGAQCSAMSVRLLLELTFCSASII